MTDVQYEKGSSQLFNKGSSQLFNMDYLLGEDGTILVSIDDLIAIMADYIEIYRDSPDLDAGTMVHLLSFIKQSVEDDSSVL